MTMNSLVKETVYYHYFIPPPWNKKLILYLFWRHSAIFFKANDLNSFFSILPDPPDKTECSMSRIWNWVWESQPVCGSLRLSSGVKDKGKASQYTEVRDDLREMKSDGQSPQRGDPGKGAMCSWPFQWPFSSQGPSRISVQGFQKMSRFSVFCYLQPKVLTEVEM